MGLEVLDQVPDLDAIVIPVGGGGLIAGSYREVITCILTSVANMEGIGPELTFKTTARIWIRIQPN